MPSCTSALGGADKIMFQLPKLDGVPQAKAYYLDLQPKLMAAQVPEKEEALQEAKWRLQPARPG